MTPEDARKLLGGYATGTLTPEEQQALFTAALEHQEIFDALTREQALKEAFDDPRTRAELLDAVTSPNDDSALSWNPLVNAAAPAQSAAPRARVPGAPPPPPRRSWLRWLPIPVAAVLAGGTIFLLTRPKPAPEVVQMAKTEIPQAITAPPPAAEPPPQRAPQPRPAPSTAPPVLVPEQAPMTQESAPKKESAQPPQGKILAQREERAVPAAAPPPPPPAPATAGAAIRSAPKPAVSADNIAFAAESAKALFDAGGTPSADMFTNRFRPGDAAPAMAAGSLAGAKRSDTAKPGTPWPGPGLKYTVQGDTITVESNFDAYLHFFARQGDAWTPKPPAIPIKAHTPLTIPVPEMLVLSAIPVLSTPPARETQVETTDGNSHYVVTPAPLPDAAVIITLPKR